MLTHIETEAVKVGQTLGLSSNLVLLERAWEAEVGSLSQHVRLAALDRQALVVEASSSAAMQEISLRRRELIRRINRHLPTDWVKNLFVRMA